VPAARLLLRELEHARELSLLGRLACTLDLLGRRVRPSRARQRLGVVGICEAHRQGRGQSGCERRACDPEPQSEAARTLRQPVIQLMDERPVILLAPFKLFVPLAYEPEHLLPDGGRRRPVGDDALEPVGEALG